MHPLATKSMLEEPSRAVMSILLQQPTATTSAPQRALWAFTFELVPHPLDASSFRGGAFALRSAAHQFIAQVHNAIP